MPEVLSKVLAHPLVSVLMGAAITWIVARYYYKRAGDELKVEARELKRTSNLILRWLENRGENIEVVRDSSGSPTGLRHQASITEAISVSATVLGGELRTAAETDAPQIAAGDARDPRA
jgi:hypothetical protein